MSFLYSNVFLVDGLGQDGATATAWLLTDVGDAVPAEDTAPPGGSPAAGPVTTDPSFGAPGAFVLTPPAGFQYAIAVQFAGHTYWAGCDATGGGGGVSSVNGETGAVTISAAMLQGTGYVEAVHYVSSMGASQTIVALDTATITRGILTAGSCALTFPTVAVGASFTLVPIQDGTGGRTLVYPSNVVWVGDGVEPTLQTAPGAFDVLSFLSVDGVNWLGFHAGDTGGGGGGGGTGVFDWLWLTVVQWAFVSNSITAEIPAYTYTSVGAGPGDFITANANGVLSIDGGSPAVNDRVVLVDNFNDVFGTFTVTDVGSVSTPWVLTRATDTDTAATYIASWAVNVIQGSNYAGAAAMVWNTEGAAIVTDPLFMAVGIMALGAGAVAEGAQNTAYGFGAQAIGAQSMALGDGATAIGANSLVLQTNGGGTQARGLGDVIITSINTSGTSSTHTQQILIGGAWVYSNSGSAIGFLTKSYIDQMAADTAANEVTGQHSTTSLGAHTTNATPTAVETGALLKIIDYDPTTDAATANWSKTMLIQGTVVARRTDTPGTDSAWSFVGVLRGNGTSAYTWVGGSAPSPTLIAQDSGATAWTFAVTVDGTTHNQIDILVTGEVANTIDWLVTLDICEVE